MVIEKIAGSIKYCAILNLLLRRTRAEENHLEQKDCQGASVPGVGAEEPGGGELGSEPGPLTLLCLPVLSGEGALAPQRA